MIFRILLFLTLCLGVAPSATAAVPPRLIADISQSRVDIVYSFAGAELLVFGAIQYPGGITPEVRPDMVIVLRGPPQSITVRRKSRILGLWLNTDSLRFETAPSFFRAASTRPVADLVDEQTAAIYELSPEYLQLSPTGTLDPGKIDRFEAGLLTTRTQEAMFGMDPGGVDIVQNVLYRARLEIPSAVPVGTYTVESHLIQDGAVVASTTEAIAIEKSGFERNVYVASQRESLLYGIFCVAIALLLGWAAAVFRR